MSEQSEEPTGNPLRRLGGPTTLRVNPQDIYVESRITSALPPGVSVSHPMGVVVCRPTGIGQRSGTASIVRWGTILHHVRDLLEVSPEARKVVADLLNHANEADDG